MATDSSGASSTNKVVSTKIAPQSLPRESLNEEEIRDYAYHLYVQNGHRNDQCGDNWKEAEACLRSNIPKAESHIRLSKNLLRHES